MTPRSKYVLGGVIAAIGLVSGLGLLVVNAVSLLTTGPGRMRALVGG